MLHAIDYILIVLFLVFTAGVGILSRGKQEKTGDFFISKGTLPGPLGSLIVGLSIAATFFSGISLLAYPSVVIKHGLVIYATVVTFIINYFLIVYFFVPLFVRKQWRSPYEILEVRFGIPSRKLASSIYVLLRLGWMAVLIYAPTIAILGATGLGNEFFWPVVLLVGLTSTVYSAFGGLRGVMVTDAMQMLVIIGGCVITIAFIALNLPVSYAETWDKLIETDSLRLFDFSLDPAITVTTWTAIIGGLFANAAMYMGDQMSLQRYMTSASMREVKHSFLVNCIGVLVILTILTVIGLSLKAWALFQDPATLPSDTDQYFPFFVASQLPVGVAGMILAALLAATMSSMTSGINALSGAIEMDLMTQRWKQQRSEKQRLVFARILSFAIGLLATLCAGVVAHLGQIFDISQRLLGLFTGPLAMAIIFAVLPWRLSGKYIIAGLLGGAFLAGFAALSPQINAAFPAYPVISPMWTTVLGMAGAALLMGLGVRGRLVK